MFLLKWLIVGITSPFWFPVVLIGVGFCLLVAGSVLIVSLALSLFIIIWLLKIFYVTYNGLIEARQEVIKDIGSGLNKNVPWWRLGRLILSRYRKQIQEAKEFREQYDAEVEEVPDHE